ncbi:MULTISPECIES: hydroxyisourate hydrolase [unclassified Undibacterium]|uniref:hydroxyisourate hydrolase n=1 Tax=unclassified Undibacterium TaxID=2630295 RepID=UPI002AC8A40E|nr:MULTISPECIES: hydroxyisourate hydrolase [unclassified Undibacterium]MEB0140780.1 hydroxyisourate hydrolase [Undibacterium sp. CCC2.1]MEB0173754.1 hydroxyisourate hydrolase [Undibacterium sp. CCC1.1]MEB0177769.1 hydroxyisourate hydrolase [Undibacterium sp. CCC3.4]MEB0216969.1 hydroxyisourate hydrolase [Undibacterium sp. 5I2]WPX44693.1 hydroxyisourate hydrolase [Undibacterium sp. CCC3.4]
MGRLTTHVLDTAHGRPGRAVALQLYRLVSDAPRTLLYTGCTNDDGRCDQALLEGAAMQSGIYELDFDLGAYYHGLGLAQTEPAFLGIVTLRFGVADPTQHYHVPLLATPWSYSTYRGS